MSAKSLWYFLGDHCFLTLFTMFTFPETSTALLPRFISVSDYQMCRLSYRSLSDSKVYEVHQNILVVPNAAQRLQMWEFLVPQQGHRLGSTPGILGNWRKCWYFWSAQFLKLTQRTPLSTQLRAVNKHLHIPTFLRNYFRVKTTFHPILSLSAFSAHLQVFKSFLPHKLSLCFFPSLPFGSFSITVS